jgi:hypothetical protein
MSEITVMKKRGSANDDEIREEARTMADEVRVAHIGFAMGRSKDVWLKSTHAFPRQIFSDLRTSGWNSKVSLKLLKQSGTLKPIPVTVWQGCQRSSNC